jgi:hypothetical protein
MWQRAGAFGEVRQAKVESGDAPGDSRALDVEAAEIGARETQVQDPPDVAPVADQPGAMPGAWRMGLVVTASALCGGIAVVLWNRRLLTKMREVAPVKREEYQAQQGRLWEDDV